MTKQEEGKLRLKFTRWPPSWIWAFQVSEPPQLLRVSLTIVYTCQDHVLESLMLESKYSKMTPKFVKQKSHWLHSSIKFANPGTLIFNVCVNNQGFDSSGFTECTSIPIHRTVFQYITIHEHQKWSITASQKLACSPSAKLYGDLAVVCSLQNLRKFMSLPQKLYIKKTG